MTAETEIEQVILRFRDLGQELGNTVRTHAELAADGGCWWGWWKKTGERVPAEAFSHLRRLAQRKSGLPILLLDTGQKQLHTATCVEIYWDDPEGTTPSPDRERTPAYYQDTPVPAWFRLSELGVEPVDADALRDLTYVRVDEFFVSRRSGFDPYYGKVVFSVDELKQQERTIWFVRAKRDHDRDHEISAVTLPPENFPEQHVVTPNRVILWLSDLHFGPHHRFPLVSAEGGGKDLASALYTALESRAATDLAAVVVSGDLTWSAQDDEFDQVREFLRSVESWASLDARQVLVCPGNHDIRWSDEPAEKGAPASTDDAPAARRAYADFYRAVYGVPPNEYLSSGRRLLLGGAYPVEIVSVNSSLLDQQAGLFQGHGYIGEKQLAHAAREMGWDASDPPVRPLRILMLHHHLVPVTYRESAVLGRSYSVTLDAGAVADWVVDHRVDVVLHGHMHQPFASRLTRPSARRGDLDEWRTTHLFALGSTGVEIDHLDHKENTFALLRFGADLEVSVHTVDPIKPSSDLWSTRIPFPGGPA